MSDNISLTDLLNLSIGTPQRGAVNFSALHALLQAVLRHLGIRDMKTRWRDAPPGDVHSGALVAVKQDRDHTGDTEEEQEGQPGTELLERISSSSSPTPSSGPAADDPWRLRSRIQTCEDGVSKAMMLIQELHDQKDNLKEEMKELRLQQKMVGAEAETVSAVEKCCHRVDALEKTVRSLRDTFQSYPDPEDLNQCVTWDVMQSTLLSERENLQKELVNSGVVDPASAVKPPFGSTSTAVDPSPPHTSPPCSPHPAAPGTLSVLAVREATDVQHTPPKAGHLAVGVALSRKASGSERYPETLEALRDIGKLKERFNRLEPRVAALEDRKVDQSELTHLRELISNQGSQDALDNLTDQLNQQRAAIDDLMSDREKLESLEDTVVNLTSPDRETSSEAASGSLDSDSKASRELRQQISLLRKSVQKLEEDVKKLKAKQALTEERPADQHLQDQLDDLRGKLEDMMLSLTSELSGSLWDEAGQDESDSQGLGQSREGSAFTSSTVNVGRKLGCLLQRYEQLQDTVSGLLRRQTGDTAGTLTDTESVELVSDVQKAILQLQAECEKLHETTRCLHEDSRQKQSHIEELYKTTEALEEKKADKQMVESEIKADKNALESKVSRLQFDSVTEQLNVMFHELLNKITGQEQDWHKVIDKLSTEMECKLNRIELDSVKKQLEGRWKNIHEKLQAQGAPEHEDAAGLRKQLVDRFHCLSCDRPVKYTPGPHSVKLASPSGFPSHKSIRPFTVYDVEQFRQPFKSQRPGTSHYDFEVASRRRQQLRYAENCRQIESDTPTQNQPGILHERVSELTDYGPLAVTRSSGGSHTITSASQRRVGLQHMKHHAQTEGDGTFQSEEVDIVGLDGHIYKGRLNTPAIRSTETKLPTISTKDGLCKTKDKPKCSPSHKPAASPEAGQHGAPLHHPHSAKSAQCSRSVSSSSGRDWPVSALGCASQSSIIPASAAAESADEPAAL